MDQVLRWIDTVARELPVERVALTSSAGRVLADDIHSTRDVPSFRRAMMDGFAVQAADTLGAATYNPLSLKIVGSVLPGKSWDGQLEQGQAVRIMTGAPIPRGADAVLPAEKTSIPSYANAAGQAVSVEVLDAVPPAKHVGVIGEDIQAGSLVLPRRRRLRPQDLGVLSSIGFETVPVVRQPRVRLVITGDELCPAGQSPGIHQTVDANGPMLQALIARDGGALRFDGILPDTPEAIHGAMSDAEADVVVVSGGSSVGQEDHAPRLLAELGEVAYHGVAMRPSSPAGMGRIGDRLVFLLPGNPVSCLCAYDFFAGRAIRRLGGRSIDWPYRKVTAQLSRKLVSVVGRQDYARVRFVDAGDSSHTQVEPIAIAGASVLSSTSRADGFVVISADSEGFPPGSHVDVFLYDTP